MEIIGYVRVGDEAACGGVVIEGDPICISDGRPYAFQGAKVTCAKNCVIAEGFIRSTLTNGRAQVIHGMKTSGGCPLLSTLNDRAGVSNVGGSPVPARFFVNADGHWTGVAPAPDDESFDEQTKLQAPCAEGMPYFVQTTDGRTFSGRVGPTGLLPRIETYGEDTYEVLWGDVALARMTEDAANG